MLIRLDAWWPELIGWRSQAAYSNEAGPRTGLVDSDRSLSVVRL
jgi:hypothetical protein